ncbi:hypothetical protein QE152_g14180 [Popillia japonica]|uniref:Uncharacterized protein n=1 Tax=Popillia japonica TaxID=7064 RepID=A0AAW1LAA3_POPJA
METTPELRKVLRNDGSYSGWNLGTAKYDENVGRSAMLCLVGTGWNPKTNIDVFLAEKGSRNANTGELSLDGTYDIEYRVMQVARFEYEKVENESKFSPHTTRKLGEI